MNKKSNKISVKKAVLITLIIFVSPILVIILIIAWGYITHPIFDKIDQDRFATLDTQIQGLFGEIQSYSNGIDTWDYKAVCSTNRTGWMKTGDYNCVVSISTQKIISSIKELNDLQTKYYPLIDANKIFKQKTDLIQQLPIDFGKNFVVSSAEKKYTELKSKIECNYLIKLNQNDKNLDLSSDTYGSKIINNGLAIISLRCSDTAQHYWYPLSDSTNSIKL